MTRYHLRAEELRASPCGPRSHVWHVAETGDVFALCKRLLDPATKALSFHDAEIIPVAHRCADCWGRALRELEKAG